MPSKSCESLPLNEKRAKAQSQKKNSCESIICRSCIDGTSRIEDFQWQMTKCPQHYVVSCCNIDNKMKFSEQSPQSGSVLLY